MLSMTTFFVLSFRKRSRSWSSRATSSTLSFPPSIRSDTAWPTSRMRRSISRFSSTLPTIACARRSAVVKGSIKPDVMFTMAWEKSVAYYRGIGTKDQGNSDRLTEYPLSAGSHATKNYTKREFHEQTVVCDGLTRTIPRLAIARATINGSLPSGEPSSNPIAHRQSERPS